MRYLRWLQEQTFEHPAHQIVLQEMVEAVRLAKERVERLEQTIAEFLPRWSLAPLVRALQALRPKVRRDNPTLTCVSLRTGPRRWPRAQSTGCSVRRLQIRSCGCVRPAQSGVHGQLWPEQADRPRTSGPPRTCRLERGKPQSVFCQSIFTRPRPNSDTARRMGASLRPEEVAAPSLGYRRRHPLMTAIAASKRTAGALRLPADYCSIRNLNMHKGLVLDEPLSTEKPGLMQRCLRPALNLDKRAGQPMAAF
jgi:hypothetical protein